MKLRMWILTALTVGLVASSAIAATARPKMRSTQVVQAASERFERMDFQGLEQLLAANARFDNMFALPNTPGTFQGRDAVIANY
ncbi:hypothetical protein [Candidatus Cyanaurora vandensis]|uniref:hypothetical protein n=1 Tax=Candidatus Cyanaurora vandensis TaxID=2714958 RepID=UPI00257CBE36|nr:hypothetical protein [Candidatus Cyanaurora vandensis]